VLVNKFCYHGYPPLFCTDTRQIIPLHWFPHGEERSGKKEHLSPADSSRFWIYIISVGVLHNGIGLVSVAICLTYDFIFLRLIMEINQDVK